MGPSRGGLRPLRSVLAVPPAVVLKLSTRTAVEGECRNGLVPVTRDLVVQRDHLTSDGATPARGAYSATGGHGSRRTSDRRSRTALVIVAALSCRCDRCGSGRRGAVIHSSRGGRGGRSAPTSLVYRRSGHWDRSTGRYSRTRGRGSRLCGPRSACSRRTVRRPRLSAWNPPGGCRSSRGVH